MIIAENITGFRGVMHQVALNPGVIGLSAGTDAHFLDCFSGQPGTGTPIIDVDNKNLDIGIRGYKGGITIRNNNKSNAISIDIDSGQIILEATVTNGTIVCRGVGKLVDTAGNIISTGAWNGATIINELVDSRYSKEQWQLAGLDSNNPMTVTPTSRTVGASVTQTITGDPETSVTVTRT